MTGKRDSAGKPRIALNPPTALIAAAKVWEYGAERHGLYNWMGGGPQFSLMRICDSLLRHWADLMAGNDIDADSGLPNTSLILTNAMMLSHFYETGQLIDDRPKKDTPNG